MKDRRQRDAALHAGGELRGRSKRRAGGQLAENPSLADLAEELQSQREWMLEQRTAFERGAEVRRTQAWLHARIRDEGQQRSGLAILWRPGWGLLAASLGLVALGLLSLPWLWLPRPTGMPIAAREAPRPESPAKPDSPPPRSKAGVSREPSGDTKAATSPSSNARQSAVSIPLAGGGNGIEPLEKWGMPVAADARGGDITILTPQVLARVQDVTEQADGSLRVQVRTGNPSVRIYLIQTAETAGENDEQPPTLEPIGGRE